MRATSYSFLFVALLLSGCTNTAFHRRSGTYAGTKSDELSVTPASEFVRAGAENCATKTTPSVPSGPSPIIADAQAVNYYSRSDLRRVPPVESSDTMVVHGSSESRAHRDEPKQRSSLIPTQWDENVMTLIPTRWDATVVFADRRQPPLPGPPTSHAR
jgi:hypothetical protein